jgi:hypothetical protein
MEPIGTLIKRIRMTVSSGVKQAGYEADMPIAETKDKWDSNTNPILKK